MGEFIPYGHQSITEEDIQAVAEVLRGDWLTQGPAVREFEKALEEYCGVRHAIACCSGTAALHLACLAAGLGPGDEVITSAITFLASANCALYVGAQPVFADIDPATALVTPETVRARLTSRTRAIIPVHLAGLSCEMEDIARQVDRSRTVIIEDACHALGGSYRGNKIGCCQHSDMVVLSFHPVKHITTGEGGAILTNSDELAGKLAAYRTHGMTKDPRYLEKQDGPWYYEMHWLGYNYRITDIQCALGTSQMRRLDAFIDRRRAIAKRYHESFQEIPAIRCLRGDRPDTRNAYHLFVIRVNWRALGISRVQFVEKLRQQGIGTQVHYYPVPLQPYYRKHFGFKPGDFPHAENYYEEAVSIPMYSAMTDKDVQRVIEQILLAL